MALKKGVIYYMNQKSSIIIAALLLFCVMLFPSSCSSDSREFKEDIVIPLEGNEGELVIKEWSFLLGSGAEIYYREGEKTVLLGKTTGGDDGYCPFANGKYYTEFNGDSVKIRWLFNTDSHSEYWKEDIFTIPKE